MRISEEPSWKDAKGKSFPKLAANIDTDVAVIGGGMAGVMAAYMLAGAGKSVTLLEGDAIGSGITAYTTAFVTQVIDTDLADLVRMFGRTRSALVWDSGAQAIDAIEEIAAIGGIECDFTRCPLYYYANAEKDLPAIQDEFRIARSLEFNHVTMGRQVSMEMPPNKGFLKIDRQAKFHPLKFLHGVAREAERLGASIYEHTPVSDIVEGKEGEPMLVRTAGREVRAKDVIVATYTPFHNEAATFLKKGMYVSYVLEVRVPKGLFEEALYQDSANPYHYFRIDPAAGDGKFDRMIIGGEDHRKELKIDPEKSFKALEGYVKDILGDRAYTVTRRWSSKVLEPSDGLPLIGRTKPHEFVATAFSGNGMTYSVIAAILLRDMLCGRRNPWSVIYDPKRIPNPYQLVKKGRDYVEELVGGAVKNLFQDTE